VPIQWRPSLKYAQTAEDIHKNRNLEIPTTKTNHPLFNIIHFKTLGKAAVPNTHF